MNILKPILGFVFLLVGVFFAFVAVRVMFDMHIIGKAYQRQEVAETIGNLIGFVLIGAVAVWLARKGWKWLTFRRPPSPSLGRSDILDDGDLLPKR